MRRGGARFGVTLCARACAPSGLLQRLSVLLRKLRLRMFGRGWAGQVCVCLVARRELSAGKRLLRGSENPACVCLYVCVRASRTVALHHGLRAVQIACEHTYSRTSERLHAPLCLHKHDRLALLRVFVCVLWLCGVCDLHAVLSGVCVHPGRVAHMHPIAWLHRRRKYNMRG